MLPLVIKDARSGVPIVTVNGVNLHSVYDPVKEAINLVSGQNLKEQVLVLGIGLGYHINALKDYLNLKFKSPKIMVLDPNIDVITKAIELNNWSTEVEIICETSIANLYNKREFVLFLSKGPSIFKHPASFDLYSDYFKKVLTFRANDSFGEILSSLNSQDLQNYLPKDGNLKEFLDYLKKDKQLNSAMDYMLLAFKHMTKLYYKEM